MVSRHVAVNKQEAPRQHVTRSGLNYSPQKDSATSTTSLQEHSTPASSKSAKKRKRKNATATQSNGSLLGDVTKLSNGNLLATRSGSLIGSMERKRRKKQLEEEEEERKKINLLRSPMRTVRYFVMECFNLARDYGARFLRYKFILPLLMVAGLILLTYRLEGPHQHYISYVERILLLCLYWIGLGVLSSIGLGTGLHTFILYLGPHIAAVTLAAYECGTLNFPQPPYPDQILCPDDLPHPEYKVTLLNIMSKVRLESFMWGLGTAIGELPPYFMARAARLSGQESEELLELQELLEEKKEHHHLTFTQKGKIFMEELVAKVGFFGILLGASIPNPLFDLAGITCGHFLVPFYTFFGATLIGKAVVKMHIQMIFVIITFSERHVEQLMKIFMQIPRLGPYLEGPFKEFLRKQKENLHRKPGVGIHHSEPSWLQFAFEKLVICMVVYFLLSIINSLAQNYHRRVKSTNQKGKGR